METPAEKDKEAACKSPSSVEQKRRVNSEKLFAGQRELLIEHAGELYFLRHTSRGKLILTK